MKKWIGRGLIAVPLLMAFALSVFEKGWIETLIAWGLLAAALGVVIGGMVLLDD